MEAAVKLARQYFLELSPAQNRRTRFISRRQSYHGITLGALAVGGHEYRRAKFEPLLMKNVSRVSPCNSFRGKNAGETDKEYVARLAKELDDEFQAVGPETVCAFVAEPVVGAVCFLPRSCLGHWPLTRVKLCRRLDVCRRWLGTLRRSRPSAASTARSSFLTRSCAAWGGQERCTPGSRKA